MQLFLLRTRARSRSGDGAMRPVGLPAPQAEGVTTQTASIVEISRSIGPSAAQPQPGQRNPNPPLPLPSLKGGHATAANSQTKCLSPGSQLDTAAAN